MATGDTLYRRTSEFFAKPSPLRKVWYRELPKNNPTLLIGGLRTKNSSPDEYNVHVAETILML